MSLKQLVDRAFGEVGREIKNGETLYFCPKCMHHKPKMSVNIETGNWKCWVCGHIKYKDKQSTTGKTIRSLFKLLKVKGSFYEELKKYKLIREDYVHVAQPDEFISLPDEFISLTIPSKRPERRQAMAYLKRRKVSAEEIVKYNIGYCYEGDYKNRLIIPSYDAHGQLNYFIARTWIKDHPLSYKNPPTSKNVIGFELFINWDLPIILVEGVFDCLALKRNVIPLFGKTIQDSLRMKLIEKNVKVVYIILDNDALANVIQATEELQSNGIEVHTVMLDGKDPSELGYKRTYSLLNSTEETSFSDLLKMRFSL